jgi:hypothetical protein
MGNLMGKIMATLKDPKKIKMQGGDRNYNLCGPASC